MPNKPKKKAQKGKVGRVTLDRHLRARGIPAHALLSKEEKAAMRKARAKKDNAATNKAKSRRSK